MHEYDTTELTYIAPLPDGETASLSAYCELIENLRVRLQHNPNDARAITRLERCLAEADDIIHHLRAENSRRAAYSDIADDTATDTVLSDLAARRVSDLRGSAS